MTSLFPVRLAVGQEPRIGFLNHRGEIELEVAGEAAFGPMVDRALVRLKGALRLVERNGATLAHIDGVRADCFSEVEQRIGGTVREIQNAERRGE